MTEFVGNPDPAEDFFARDGKQHCWACGSDWPLEQTFARFCGECGHIWPTDSDLIDHDASVRREIFERALGEPESDFGGPGPMPYPRPVEQIMVCPCCAHDL